MKTLVIAAWLVAAVICQGTEGPKLEAVQVKEIARLVLKQPGFAKYSETFTSMLDRFYYSPDLRVWMISNSPPTPSSGFVSTELQIRDSDGHYWIGRNWDQNKRNFQMSAAIKKKVEAIIAGAGTPEAPATPPSTPADQPATKAANKVPAGVQPPPPTSRDVPQ